MAPETRSSDALEAPSSDTRRRFDSISTMDASLQLPLLSFFSCIALLASSVSIAASGASLFVASSVSSSSTASTTPLLSRPFSDGSFILLAPLFSRIETLSPGRCLTVMPNSINLNSSGPCSTAGNDLKEALDVAVFKNAIFSVMKKLSISPSIAYSPPTLLIRRYLNATRRPSFVSVDGVNVTFPDLFYGCHLAIHGFNGILSLRSSEASRAVSGSPQSNFSYCRSSPPRSGLCSSVIDPVMAPLLGHSTSSFSSFLTELGTSFIISIVLMLVFACLSAKHGNDVVYYPNRILKGLTQFQGSSKTQNPFSWIKEVLSSSEQNVITMSGVASAVYFVFLSIVLGVLVLSGLANVRTTLEASTGVGKAFITAFRSDAEPSFLLAAIGLLVLYIAVNLFKLSHGDDWDGLFEAISGYGLGGSSMALFRRVDRGFYTKAADVGADMGGKDERKIPEDNPRNPAVIVDKFGDIAEMDSDLFGSHAASSCAALVIASISSFGLAQGYKYVIIPIFAITAIIFVSFSFAARYGIAGAALGMLNTIATGLDIAVDGPISDNAGGIDEIAGISHRIRESTDALDSVGNTTAAVGKGFAIGSAARDRFPDFPFAVPVLEDKDIL